MDLSAARPLLARQDDVVASRQLASLGATDVDVRRWLRCRELVAVHPGVYVAHTGPPTWHQRAWAAVLLHRRAALCHASAVHLEGEPIHVALPAESSPARRPGVRWHFLGDLEERVRWNVSPPRVKLEDAALAMCADAPDRSGGLAIVSDLCVQRRTTPERLLAELGRRPRVRHRGWLLEALREADTGVQSLLESGYLRRVERAHGLPCGTRQARAVVSGRVAYRDVLYDEHGVAVELDGRVGHELSRDRWRDMDRDLDAAVGGLLTLRVGWRHVEDEPCATAYRLATVLRARGWSGFATACGPDCRLGPPDGQPIAAAQ